MRKFLIALGVCLCASLAFAQTPDINPPHPLETVPQEFQAAAQSHPLNLELPISWEEARVRHLYVLQVQDKDDPLCQHASFILTTNSSHNGGGRNGKNNENNGGVGFRCYFEVDPSKFWQVVGQENSRYGAALTLSIGKRADLLLLRPGTIYAGIAGNLTYYEVRGRLQIGPGEWLTRLKGFIIFPHPTVFVGGELKIPGTKCSFSAEQNYALKGVNVRALGLKCAF